MVVTLTQVFFFFCGDNNLLNSVFNVAAFTIPKKTIGSYQIYCVIILVMTALNRELLLASCQFLMACGGEEWEEKTPARAFISVQNLRMNKGKERMRNSIFECPPVTKGVWMFEIS